MQFLRPSTIPHERRATTRTRLVAGLMGLMMAVATMEVAAQVAGTTTLGVSVEEIKAVAPGWSAKKQVLGKPVYNDNNERVGEVDDIIIAPDKSISYAIIGVGGFLGLSEHHVAVPFNQVTSGDGKIVLPGATKDKLKAIPKFDYAK
jgi:sporulation protein YlmC with PRC-barrel domain